MVQDDTRSTLGGCVCSAYPSYEGIPKIQKTDKTKITSGLYVAILSEDHFVSEKVLTKKEQNEQN